MKVFPLLILVVSSAIACSSSTGMPATGAGGSTASGGGAGTGTGGGPAGAGGAAGSAGSGGSVGGSGGSAVACNTLAVTGPVVMQTAKSGTPPAPAGGAVVDGIYVLTEVDVFAPLTVDSGYHEQNTMQVSGDRLDQADRHGLTYTSTFYTAGTTWTTTTMCGYPPGHTTSLGYTATPTTIMWIPDTNDWVDIYTKQ